MNNKHQELIEKAVDELCDFDFYTDGGNIGAKEVEPWLRKTLQATIDTVLKEERERVTNLILLRAQQMSELYGSKLPFVCLGNDEEACRMSIYLAAHEDIIKTLDKTPPNKI